MRTFAAAFNTERAKRGCAPVNLIEFGFTPPVRLSDRDISAPDPDVTISQMTETDTPGWLSISGETITVTGMDMDDTAYCAIDMGAGGIDGALLHKFNFKKTAGTDIYDYCCVWAIANTAADVPGMGANALKVIAFGTSLMLHETTSGVYDLTAIDIDTDYYVTVRVDPAAGTYGTVYADIYTDAERTVLFDTLSIERGSDTAFRYLLAAASSDSAHSGNDWSGEISDLAVFVTWSGLVAKWGFLDTAAGGAGRGLLGSVDVTDLALEVINSQATPFSSHFATEPPESIEVRLFQYFGGLLVSEMIFRGIVWGQPEYDQRRCRMTVRSIWERYNRLIGSDLIISADDFASADPDDIGLMRNIVIGDCNNVKCRGLVAGVVDTLRDDLDLTSTSFYVSLGSKVNFPSGTVTVQIDAEQIQGTYTPSTGQFASCTRGYNSTTAVSHNKGAAVAQVLTSYVWETAAHPVKTIGDVRVDGVKQTSGYTAYTGQSGDELTGYAGTAVIKFTALPVVKRQVNLETSVGTGSHAHTSTVSSTVTRTGTGHADPQSDWANESNAYDGNDSTYATGASVGDDDFLVITFNETDLGTVLSRRVKITYSSTMPTYSSVLRVRIGSESPQSFAGTGGGDSTRQTIYRTFSGDSWDLDVYIDISSGSAQILVNEVEVEVTYSAGINPAAADGVTLTIGGNSSADTVVGQVVTADVSGWLDDGSGTYTGTASALIERCDHVFKLLWGHSNLIGAALADLTVEAAAATYFSTNTYAFALRICEPIRAADLLAKLALQCRSRFFVSPRGAAALTLRATGKTSGHSLAMTKIRDESMRIKRTHGEDLINVFTVRHSKDFGKDGNDPGQYSGALNFSDATSITDYGRREREGSEFLFDAVTGDAQADDVGDFILAWHKDPRRIFCCDVFLDNMEIEPGDTIDITHDLDSLTAQACEVLSISHTIGSGAARIMDRIGIEAIEV